MAAPRHVAALTAAFAALVGPAACGGGSPPGQILVRVGDTPITRATLVHWMKVMSGGREAPASGHDQALRRQALRFLISSQWLIGEAARRGLSIAEREVHEQIGRMEKTSFPGGLAELREFLKSTGESVSDVELQARTEVARAKLRQTVDGSVAQPTAAQIAAYYARHRERYGVPERRELSMANRKTRAAAEKLKRDVEAGRSSLGAAGEWSLAPIGSAKGRTALERAIHAARSAAIVGPVRQRVNRAVFDYFVFKVTRVLPARQRTLAQVRGSIDGQLLVEARHRALAAFLAGWRARWTAKTDCKAGYVVQKCSEYEGPITAEEGLGGA